MIRNQHKIFLFIILIACSTVLFRNLDALTVRMWDESRNSLNALEMTQGGNPLVSKFEGQPDLWSTKPPLLIWSMAISMKIFGFTEFAIRLPSIISVLIAMFFVFFILYKISNQNILAAFGAICLITFPGFIDYHIARNGDYDAMLTMWILIAFVCYYLWLSKEHAPKNYLYLCALALAGGVLTKGVAGLLVIPGFFFLTLLFGKFKTIVSSKETYISIVLFLIPVVGYYVAREVSAPGFINAMIENELTGRYMNVTEEHAAEPLYYIKNLIEWRMGVWLYVLGLSIIVLIAYGRNNPIGKVMVSALIVSLSFLLIISSSKTKLPWYDAPVFPLLAIVCGGGLMLILNKLIAYSKKSNKKFELGFQAFLILVLSVYPFLRIHSKTSVNATYEQTYPELYYGDVLKAFFKGRPHDKITVVFDGYNSHALYYIRSLSKNGYLVTYKNTSEKFLPGELILTCEAPFYDLLAKRYIMEEIYENSTRKLSIIIDKVTSVNVDSLAKANDLLKNKILEIKTNAEWSSAVEAKAKSNGVTSEVQFINDAIYILEINKEITVEEAAGLKELNLH